MSGQRSRILIFGAGVIGSTYAIKLMEAGLDVTMLARSERYRSLKDNGLQYSDKGKIRSIPIKVIDTLEPEDRYDYILVTVRYDGAESALLALKDNHSPNIVTMISNVKGFAPWQAIVGERLLPAFPGVGGQIKDGVLYARVPPKLLAATRLGEINSTATERVRTLAALFKAAKLPCTLTKDMRAYLLTHAASDIALLGALRLDALDEDARDTRATARQITTALKAYVHALQSAGIAIDPPLFRWMLRWPNGIVDRLFRAWLSTNMVKDMRRPDYASQASREIMHLRKDLLAFLGEHQIKLDIQTQ